MYLPVRMFDGHNAILYCAISYDSSFDMKYRLNNESVLLIININFCVRNKYILFISVNATTDKKTTVSVIRVGSPTPSMESSAESSDNDIDEGEENEDESENSESEENPDAKTKKKKKNSKPRIALTVESFYNPEEANKFAKEIMCKF